ncbi:MAG: VanZ family protein [Bacilli bacterium]|nr:VanZ family protein [Bacilli bacterium]MDD7314324.1 VanZ family protein [Bacilli bacterium]
MIKTKGILIKLIYNLFFLSISFLIVINIEQLRIYSIFLKTIIVILLTIILSYTLAELFEIKQVKTNVVLVATAYSLFLIIILMCRKQTEEKIISNPDYIKIWWKIIFTNKIVFLNLIGNLFLYFPFGIILKKKGTNIIVSILLMIIVIVSMELLQYITKRGIFDYIDIILNLLGSLIGYMLVHKEDKMYEKSIIK